jgi:hypothetical protein
VKRVTILLNGYFELSTTIRHLHKRGPAALFRMPRIRRRLVRLLQAQANSRYLI